jgi:hypothetical protein
VAPPRSSFVRSFAGLLLLLLLGASSSRGRAPSSFFHGHDGGAKNFHQSYHQSPWCVGKMLFF